MIGVGFARPWFIPAFDSLYRWYRRLDAADSDIFPVLLLEIRRAGRNTTLADGTIVRRGDRIGVLHLNNRRVATLHRRGLAPMAIGLAFKSDILRSLEFLATLARSGGRLDDVRAFTVVTILHHGLPRLGFEFDARRILGSRIIAAYQRALLASLHPGGVSRTLGLASSRAERLWISTGRLVARYGTPVARAG